MATEMQGADSRVQIEVETGMKPRNTWEKHQNLEGAGSITLSMVLTW